MEVIEHTKQLYELSFHLLGSLDEGALASELDKVRAVVSKHGGVIVREQQPERFQLAYTIVSKNAGKNVRHDSSYFGGIFFEANGDEADAINKALSATESVLRHLLIGVSREALAPQQRHAAPAAKKAPVVKQQKTADVDAPKMTKEAMDKEIENLVVE